jgi:DNA (cytosine-5)-methyltransferase 1
MARKIISLFSGAGGMDIGFHKAGFETAVAVEKDPSCCATLRLNMPNLSVIEGDIQEISTEEILKVGKMAPLEAALVVGGPPCQSFSLAGKRMGMDDSRGKLVMEYIRVVRESLPVAFVMENVRGMVNWAGGEAIDAILSEASREIIYDKKVYKYKVSYEILNAVDYGAAQFRERVIIVGNRIGKKFNYPMPTHTSPSVCQMNLFRNPVNKWATVWDAIGGLPSAEEPSETALRVSGTIRDRIVNHGY